MRLDRTDRLAFTFIGEGIRSGHCADHPGSRCSHWGLGDARNDKTYSAIATGELTLHGVTRTIETPLDAQFTNEMMVIVESLEVLLAGYHIVPTTLIALTVKDGGGLEVQIVLSSTG